MRGGSALNIIINLWQNMDLVKIHLGGLATSFLNLAFLLLTWVFNISIKSALMTYYLLIIEN